MIVKETLRALATLRPAGHKILSLYLNLDPSEFPTPRDRATELDSLLTTAEHALREDSLDRAQRQELKHDIEHVREWFEKQFDASGTRGLVVFAASGADLFEVHTLARPISSEVVIDDSPFIEPLTAMLGGDSYCVLLINRQIARILTGNADRMSEISAIVDDVHSWHDQGGWSQARFQRGIAKEVHDHVKHAADELFSLFKRGHVQRLIIGAQPESRGEVEKSLHSYLRDRIVGWIDIDMRSTPTEVARRASPTIVEDERKREQQWLERLQAELGRDSRGVCGLADTLGALNERRAETLLVREGFRAPGYATASADFLATEPGSSPRGEELAPHEDVIEPAIESALEQSAEIAVIRHAPGQLDALGSIGAVLRF
ncbi:MAG: Vms1/Ankzf1 family peptidyl-tRNA hydrolase [Solirubrobacterales bacterium]